MLKISICLILTLFSLTINAGEILEGRVVGVHDGDTVTLLMAGNQQIKIRLVEKDAREAKVGLWSDSSPTPPWEYRHGKKISAVRQTASEVNTPINASNPSCGRKRYCKEMCSCEEAKFYLTQCDLTRLDGDHDGVPCESLCGHGR